MIGRYSTSSAQFPAIFALIIFQIGFHTYTQSNLDSDPPIYTSHVAGVAGTQHYVHLLVKIGLCLLFFN
jgi:hypothetical protein